MTVSLTGNEDAIESLTAADRADDGTEATPTSTNLNNNHYDNPKLSKHAEIDLPMNPGEDCAMFYGLEVLDSSQYQVVGTGSSKRLVIVEQKQPGETDTTKSKRDPGQSVGEQPLEETSKESRKKRKREKKRSKDTLTSGGDDQEILPATKKGKGDAKEKDALIAVNDANDAPDEKTEPRSVSPEQLALIQSTWSEASGGAHIHKRLLESLTRLGFDQPTPIQAATLSASIMGRRNLVGAAPTGSGKTIAFLLPILNYILEQTDDDGNNGEILEKASDSRRSHIQALIMTPTRELATQIHSECDKLLPGQCVTLVGGIALVKQKRLLETKKPSIVIATPGRLWAMVRATVCW